MKKVIACVCVFLMLLAMVGCAPSSATSSMAASQGAEYRANVIRNLSGGSSVSR